MKQGNDKKQCCLIVHGDSRAELKQFAGQADLLVMSPPYADARKRHYDSIHPDNFAEWFAGFHQPFWDALREDGSMVINIKDKVVDGVRHRFVWRMIDKLSELGWCCIDDYIWHKPNPMPGYWPTRLRDGWEYCFHLAKTKRPYVDQDAVRKPVGEWVKTRLAKLGSNDLQRHNSINESGFGRDISKWIGKTMVLPSNVLSLPLVGKNKGHPAVYPVELPLFFIKMLSRPGGLVIDPFGGSGSTAVAALTAGRDCVLIDNDADYCDVAYNRVMREAQSDNFEVSFSNVQGSHNQTYRKHSAQQMALILNQRHAVYQPDSVQP